MAFIATTKALLDKEARQSVREEARLYLGTDNTLVCDLFQKGKWFIKETWTDPAMLAVKLKAAENEQLEAAIVENW